MSFFKRFSDLLVGFCALCGIVGLLRNYMTYDFSEETLLLGTTEKIKLFLSPDAKGEPRHFAFFVMLMLLSLVIGRIFSKLPILPLVASALPFFHSLILFFDSRLGDTPFFYILCLAAGFAAALYDSVSFDSQKNLTLTHHAAALFGVIFGGLMLLLPHLSEKHTLLTTIIPSDAEGASRLAADRAEVFGINLFKEIPVEQLELMKLLLLLTVISLVVSYLLRGAYFIDLIFAAAIGVLCIVKWHAGVLTHSIAPVLALSLLYFAARLAIFFAEPEPKPLFIKKTTAED